MRNIFLSIPKDLFDLDLSLLSINLLAQVIEWDRNNKVCYETDAALAKRFKSSPSTVNRTIGSLAKEGYLIKKTENTKDGKMRTLSPNLSFIETQLSKLQLATEPSVNLINDNQKEENQLQNLQMETKPTSNLLNGQLQNLQMRNKQGALIKDKREKENLKDKIEDLLSHSLVVSPTDAKWIELTVEEWCNIGFASQAHLAGEIDDNRIYQVNGNIYIARQPSLTRVSLG